MPKLESLSIRFDCSAPGGALLQVLDQQQLPHNEVWLYGSEPESMYGYIKSLQVRGAPMIGVAAALSLACYALKGASKTEFQTAAKKLREARPTAVNLMYAIDQLQHAVEVKYDPAIIMSVAETLFNNDRDLCDQIADNGLSLIKDGDQILTHCNTGALATVGVGTAIGIIRKAHIIGRKLHVYVDETRPLNQGGRLTAWELGKLAIPYTLICDNMAGALMAQGKVSKVFVGADRIATNGDFANKIGTYSLAVLASHHNIPFYVAAPFTTFDANCHSGKEIPIEERNPDEVRSTWAPKNAPVYNPSFDVTPADLVSGWVTDRGLFSLDEVRGGRFSC